MKLQSFIEKNVGKRTGDDYVYDSVILHTGQPLGVDVNIVEVRLYLPWTDPDECYGFMERYDSNEITDHVDFYKWLIEHFFPLAQKSLGKVENG